METKISATELTSSLPQVLNRIRDSGERFVIERDGELVASLGPVNAALRVTVHELFERLRAIGLPDTGFADDLEALQTTQPKIGVPERLS